MATKRTAAQRAQLAAVNRDKGKLTRKYAFRMHKWLAKWRAEGMSQQAITDKLNEAGARVPSEYDGSKATPRPVKQWHKTTVARFIEDSDLAYERMVWWCRARGKRSMPAYGDGAGLFRFPLLVMDSNPNHDEQVMWGTAGWEAFKWRDAFKDKSPLDAATLERIRLWNAGLVQPFDLHSPIPEVAWRAWLEAEAAKPSRVVRADHPQLQPLVRDTPRSTSFREHVSSRKSKG